MSGVVAAYVFIHRFGAPTPEPPPADFAGVRLRTHDGVELGAWLGRVPDPRGTVVLLHGNGASRTSMTDEALELRKLGFDVLPVTVRAHGDSGGTRNDFGWTARNDVEAAVRYVSSLNPGRPIIVYGQSLGAASALFAAPALGERVAAYVLVSPYARLDEAVEHRTDRYLPPILRTLAYSALLVGARAVLPDVDRIAPEDAARQMPRDIPALLFAGARDDRAPVSDARRIMASLHDAELVVRPGADHEDMELGRDEGQMRAHLERFLDRVAPRIEAAR